MSLRRRLAWAVAIVAGAALLGSVSAYLVVTRTGWGRQKFIAWALTGANHALGGRGRLTVGVLREMSGKGIRASDVSIVDTAGVVVLHVNELYGKLVYSALLSKTVHIAQLDLQGVELHLNHDFRGPWNIAYIINGGPKHPGPHLPAFGDDISIDAVTLSDGVISMQYPWAPNAAFTGKQRDSVIAVRRSMHAIVPAPEGLFERRRILLPRVVAHDVVVATPTHVPSSLRLDTLGGSISDPTIRVVQAGGNVRWTPDSLLLDLPSVALPASSGSAKGKVHWDQPGAVRYDVTVNARASLSDLGWVWNVLPTTGEGSATVRMRTLASADDAEYTLSKLDVTAMRSHVTGDITVVSRPLDMLLQGVDLSFTPLRTELLRRLSYDAVPAELQGTLRGHLVARTGGPLTSMLVDRLDGVFDDDRVPGAQSSISLAGLIGLGAAPTAHNVRVASLSADLRSLHVLAPSMPPADGVVTGTVLVANVDLQHAAIPSLDLRWTDAVGNMSHLTGHADAHYAGAVASVNTELVLDPLTLKALVRLDSTFPLSPTLRGTVSAEGSLDSLRWHAVLANGDDKLTADGHLQMRDSAWTVQANTDVASINFRNWLGDSGVPSTSLNGTVNASVAGRTLADGTTHIADALFAANLKQAATEDRPEFSLRGNGRLDAQRLQIDSAGILLGGITIGLEGALARDSTAVDTLVASLQADSLSAARPELVRLAAMLLPVDSALSKTLRGYATDTLAGDVSGTAVMVGSLPAFRANVSLSARDMKVGIVKVRRVFGSVRATGLPDHAHFDATATVDDITGVGQVRLSTADFRIEDASPDGGRLRLDVLARDTTALRVRGAFTRVADVLAVTMDSLRFNYGSALWRNTNPVLLTSDTRGVRLDSLIVRSNQGGLLALNADIPETGAVDARLRIDRFPAGEVASFATGSATRLRGLMSGDTQLSGTRLAPVIVWNMRADSVGTDAAILPPLVTDGRYENEQLVAHAVLPDSLKSRLRIEARVPIDLSLQSVATRLLSKTLDAEIVADSLKLESLPDLVQGVSHVKGILEGRLAVTGTMNRPIATGRLTLDGFSASVDALGIKPSEGRIALAAQQDQLNVEQFRVRSGSKASDTLGLTGVLKFPADVPMTVEARMVANSAALARQSDGTDVDLSGTVTAKGPITRPDVTASLFVPRANLVADPLGARSALDLGSAQARELLGATEVPVAASSMTLMARLGQYMTVSQASLRLGDEVWVRTPESAVKLGGALDIKTGTDGLLAFDGEVTANRGIFRLDLGVVNRSFTVDSGRVRFYGSEDIPPSVGVYATHVVRTSGGVETPIHVAIAGTLENLSLKLSTDDEVFSGAPETEVISLLVFGAPTFALNGPNQSTVRTVTGILLPTFGGLAEGTLQKLLPGLNTVQISAPTGQEEFSSASSLLNNLNVAAGKQLGDKTFLRFNTGLCRGSSTSSDIRVTTGLSAEYRFTRTLLAQIGVDQGASPCTQLGAGGSLPRYQFGFDLFREWVF